MIIKLIQPQMKWNMNQSKQHLNDSDTFGINHEGFLMVEIYKCS